MFENISGHKKQLELLEKALGRERLAHAYVFAGPNGVGKKLIAKMLAHELLGTKSDSFHPDFLEIDGAEGVKIEQVRELVYKLSLKPYQAKNKVALIDQAHLLTTEAANALLKSLEEPRAYNYIFLITSNPNRLPKTILSRCQKLTFGPLRETGPLEDDLHFETFMSDDLAGKLVTAYEIADLEIPQIKSLLDTWLEKLQRSLESSASRKLGQKISQVLLSRKFLDQNVNTKLLLTNLMLNT